MKLFEITHKLSGKLLAIKECESLRLCVESAVNQKIDLTWAYLTGAYLRGAYLRGADLTWADLTGADLTGADLTGADLTGAYLRGADLRGADLTGADLTGVDLTGAYLRGADGEKIKTKEIPLQILGLRWDILILDSHMKIGCEFHAIKEWSEFNDERINDMDSSALEFWEKSKLFILNFCKANGRG